MKNPSRYARERMLLKHKPRKVLNLEERVLAIRLYHQTPVYQRIASMFKCSWEQIKNIIHNTDAILEYYKRCQVVDPADDPQLVRYKKINFLGNAMYEFVKRAHYHNSAVLNDDLIRKKALQFRDVIKIEKFYPNKTWIADFKHVYNIDLQALTRMIIPERPQKSLDCKEIVAYCTRMVDMALACHSKTSKLTKKASMNVEENSNVSTSLAYHDEGGVRVVNESDNFEDLQLNEECMDEDEINENEEGPTIDFGAYECGDELLELRTTTPIPAAQQTNAVTSTKQTTSGTVSPVSSTLHGESQTELLPAIQIKMECPSRSPSPIQQPATPPPSIDNCTDTWRATTDMQGNCIAETTTAQSISNYAEALQCLHRLEDFAYQEEDFCAVNLLSQLADVFERHAKRPKALHSN